MEVININVKQKIASVEGSPIIVCGNSDYTMAFTFDEEWNDEENKVARFSYVKNGLKGFIDAPIHDGICQVPVLIGIGLVRVGAYAGNLRTTTGAKIKCQKSILCDDAEEMAEPFENLYEEMHKEIDNIVVDTDNIGDGAVTINKVEQNFFKNGVTFVSPSGDIDVNVTTRHPYPVINVCLDLKNKTDEITEESTNEIPTAKAVVDYVNTVIGGIENGSY